MEMHPIESRAAKAPLPLPVVVVVAIVTNVVTDPHRDGPRPGAAGKIVTIRGGKSKEMREKREDAE
jgi:hypothetical protein